MLAAFVPAIAAELPAQSTSGSSIVQADKVVVVGSSQGDAAAGVACAVVDPSEPVFGQSWSQVTSQIPNLQVESGGSSSFGAIYSLRGLANTPYFSEPAVTLYFDNIPLGGSFSYPTDLFGFAAATLFRGPQPTAFGRAGDGGVIIFSPPPPASSAGGELRAGIGNFDSRWTAVEGSGPEGDRASLGVSAAYTARGGYVDNTQIGQRVDNQRAVSAFAREMFRPTAASELSLEILANRHRDGAAPLVPLNGPLYTVERSQEGATDADMFGAALKAAFDTDAGRFTTVTSYTNWKLNPYLDWLVLPPAIDSHLTQAQEAWNEELRLASNSREGLSWNIGAWLSEGTTTGAADRSINGLFPFEVSDFDSTKRESALFGAVALQPAKSWQVSIGARVQRTEKDYRQDEQVPTQGLHFHFTRTDDAFLPRAVATLDVTPGTTANASISFGSRPGGYAAYTDHPSLIPFAAESTAAYEAGLQSSLAGKTLVLSARAFDYEIRNYQIERSFSPTDYFVATAPKARSLGAELEAAWKPSIRWTIRIAAGITDARLLEFNDPLTGKSYAGNRAPYSPAYTAGLNVGYRSAAGWFAAGGVSATGKTFYSESENPIYAQGAYAVLDSRAGFDATKWRITFYIYNATDKGYYSLIVPGVNSASPAAPRTVGSEIALKF